MMVRSFKTNRWSFGLALLAALVTLPLLYIAFLSFGTEATSWKHITENLLFDYLKGSFLLVVAVAFFTFLLGFSSAVFISFFEFPGRKFLEWALILPLSIPAYLLSFSYADMCSYTGWIRIYLGIEIDLLNFWGAVFVFSMALFPYVYLPLKSYFKSQGASVIEAAQSLGANFSTTVFSILLPLSRPAWFGGILLASMEVLNDYGVVKYYGVPTLTAGIFRAWFSFGDVQSALRLAAMVLLFVFVIIGVEYFQRRKKQYAGRVSKSYTPKKTSLAKQTLIIFWLILLLTLSFLLPLFQILIGVYNTAHKIVNSEFFAIVLHSFLLAGAVALMATILALFLEFVIRLNKKKKSDLLFSKAAAIGYAIPGAVIAIGVLTPAQQLDSYLNTHWPDLSFTLSTGLGILFYGILVRFMAVAIQATQSGFETHSPNLMDAARIQGLRPIKVLYKLNVPLLKSFLISAFILVFIDVLKELPLTLILRPFNFDTLASKAFDLASDELLQESANPALLIVLLGLIPVYFLNRIVKRGTT